MTTNLGPEGHALAPETDLLMAHQLLHSRAGELRNAEEAFGASFDHYQRLLNEQFDGKSIVITDGEVELSVNDQTDAIIATPELPIRVAIERVAVEEYRHPEIEVPVRQFRPVASGNTVDGRVAFWLDAVTFTFAPEQQDAPIPQ